MEKEVYYVVREKNNPLGMGLTIRLKEGKLENLTGNEDDLTIYGCVANPNGTIGVSGDCFAVEIARDEAHGNEEGYHYWTMMQGYVATDASIDGRRLNGTGAFT